MRGPLFGVLFLAFVTTLGPITYRGPSGRQYVAILAGGGAPIARSVDPAGIGGRLHVYALPVTP